MWMKVMQEGTITDERDRKSLLGGYTRLYDAYEILSHNFPICKLTIKIFICQHKIKGLTQLSKSII